MEQNPARIVIATQGVEGNLPALRLLKICAEFGPVAVITPHAGPETCNGISFRRIIPGREIFYRGLRVLIRKAGALLPKKARAKWIEGFTEEAFGILHQGRNFRKAWKRHKLRPDLLVLDGAEFMTTAGAIARAAGIPVVYYVHEMFPNQRAHYARALSNWYCHLERRECRQARRILVQHHLWGKLIRRRYRVPADKFVEVTPSPEPQDPLPGSGPEEPLRLYSHGLFTNGRGLEELIRGVALVPGVHLDLRGSGHYEDTLRRIVAETGAGDRIRFLPPVPTAELAASGRSYDFGVVTGTKEHLNGRMVAGMKLYENIAAGIALFGYDALTLRHTARRYGIGITYRGDSPEGVAAALRKCLERREWVAAARQKTAEIARRYFNSETQYARLREVISAALSPQ